MRFRSYLNERVMIAMPLPSAAKMSTRGQFGQAGLIQQPGLCRRLLRLNVVDRQRVEPDGIDVDRARVAAFRALRSWPLAITA